MASWRSIVMVLLPCLSASLHIIAPDGQSWLAANVTFVTRRKARAYKQPAPLLPLRRARGRAYPEENRHFLPGESIFMSVSNPTANSVTDAAADKPAHQSTLTTVEKYRRYVNTSAVKGIEPLVISRAEGANVTTQDGQTFLDCFAGIAVVNAGHRNPEVLDAVRAQLEKLIHCCSYVYYVEPVADLAERLAQATPGALQKTFFCNSGAEAIEG